ncbi:hypothetical protein [Polaromonas sp. P5_D5]
MAGLVVALLTGLTGCSTMEAVNRDQTQLAAIEKNAPANAATLRLRSFSNGTARFGVSPQSASCEGFKDVGVALNTIEPSRTYAGRERKDIVEVLPQAGPVQIRAYAQEQHFANNITYKSKCGPVAVRFVADPQKKYTADLIWKDKRCTIVVNDTTSSTPIPVPGSNYSCPASFSEILD